MDPLAQLNHFLSRHLSPAVKKILLINVVVFLAIQIGYQIGLERTSISDPRNVGEWILDWVWENPRQSLGRFFIWQFLTYMFVHEQGMHLLFNMIILWFFGPELEHRWGTRQFWRFYLITGAGAGLLHAGIAMTRAGLGGPHMSPIIGASGALFGVLFAFGTYYPDRTVLLWGVIPVMMKYLVAGIIVIEVLTLPAQDGVSHLTHLTGLAVAFVLLSRYHHTTDFRRWRYMR